MPPKHARCVSCVYACGRCLPCVLSFCWVTTATLSLHEHRVAVGTAADSLRHLRLRGLRPILDCASSEYLSFMPLLKITWASCLWKHTRATGTDYGFPFQRNLQYWLPVFQAMNGKLYVLSLFYMMYVASTLRPSRCSRHF